MRIGLRLCLLALAAVLAPAVAGAASGAGVTAHTAAVDRYVHLAEMGIGQANDWRAASGGWFNETAPASTPTPLLTVWGAVGLLQGVDAVELVSPSAAHLARVNWFARKAEGFWNQAQGGYAPYQGWKSPSAELWFDDNGWLGLSFVSAYQATHDRRYVRDAQRAFAFIMARGWDRAGGGLWWNTLRNQKAGEALAAASLLGALLYGLDHRSSDLQAVRQLVDWAQSHDYRAGLGLYGSLSARGNAAVDYIQAPLVYAQYLLCQATGQQRYCRRAAQVADSSLRSYGDRLNFAPQYDAIYLQWMMAYGQQAGDQRFVDVAERNAAAAAQHADASGRLLGSWWGGPIGDSQTGPGMLRTVGATTSLFAWVAYYLAIRPAPAPAAAQTAPGGPPTPATP